MERNDGSVGFDGEDVIDKIDVNISVLNVWKRREKSAILSDICLWLFSNFIDDTSKLSESHAKPYTNCSIFMGL